MWRHVVLWQASVMLVTAFLDIGFFTQKPRHEQLSQMNCYDYPDRRIERLMKIVNSDYRYPRPSAKHYVALPPTMYTAGSLSVPPPLLLRRIDTFLPQSDDVVKEHAKLVQDINSLKQLLFVAPLANENKDYDESVFHEIIETSSTTTFRPSTKSHIKSSSIPVILVGGASQRQVVKSPPLPYTKPVINLVGTTSNPLLKHPYPFVMQSSSKKPLRICMSAFPTAPSTRRPPSLWERLLNAIIPR